MHTLAQRRLAAIVIAGVFCVALGVSATNLSGRPGDTLEFLFFLISLPWTLSVYVFTMVFDLTSPVAIGLTLALTTLVAWRYVSRAMIRLCVEPASVGSNSPS